MDDGHLKGTLLISAITADGILMLSDSRMGMSGGDQISAYMDCACKITFLKKFPISFAGSSLIKLDFIYNLIDDFNKNYILDVDIKQTIADFRKYLKDLSNTRYTPFIANITTFFIVGGYYKNYPYLFSFNNEVESVYKKRFAFSEPDLKPYLENYKKEKCSELISILEKVIRQYAKDKKREHLIGGPISIVKIDKLNQVTWIQNDFTSNKFPSYKSFLEALKSGILKITPLIQDGVEMAIISAEKRYNFNI